MKLELVPRSQKPEEAAPKVGAFESWVSALRGALVFQHFVETKQSEIKAVVAQAKERTDNPLLIGDVVLNAASKFIRIVDDYRIETERQRADLRNDTAANLDNAFNDPNEQGTEGDITEAEETANKYSRIDFKKELTADERETAEAFRKLLKRELDKRRSQK